MAWSGPLDTPVSARIAAVGNALLPTERCVVESISSDPALAVESTAQQVADRANVSRASVIRAAQTLGYEGYPQLRVALARELTTTARAADTDAADAAGALPALQRSINQAAARLPHITSLLDEETVSGTIESLATAKRLLVVGNGLSAPMAMDASMRLNGVGRSAEYAFEALSQQIIATQLGPGSACLLLSGSGSNRLTLDTARAAKDSGASIIALTSFIASPLADLADHLLVIPSPESSFVDELEHTSRLAHMLVIECLADAIDQALNDQPGNMRLARFSVLGRALGE